MTYKRELDSLRTKLLSSSNGDQGVVIEDEPSREYETYRRRAYRDVQELWFYIRSKLESLGKGSTNLGSKVTDIVKDLETREQVVLMDLDKMKAADGHEEWRKGEAEDLSALVQARLKYLQVSSDWLT